VLPPVLVQQVIKPLKDFKIMKQPSSIKLCCGKAGCPEVSILSNNRKKIRIKDDYGNVVTITADEAKLLGDAVDQLLK
jgi:hypothetical protein